MTCIHGNKVKKINECNLLHDIRNPSECKKKFNSPYSPILTECTNTRKGRSEFKNPRILLDSGCSSTIVMGRIIKTISPKEYAMMQWYAQAGIIITNLEMNIEFILPDLSATKTMMWNCLVGESAMGR